jgi:hypothetical protein
MGEDWEAHRLLGFVAFVKVGSCHGAGLYPRAPEGESYMLLLMREACLIVCDGYSKW